MTALAFSLALASAWAQPLSISVDCAGAARSAVERLKPLSPIAVKQVRLMTQEELAGVISSIERVGPAGLGLSPEFHRRLLKELKTESDSEMQYLVETGEAYYLISAAAANCATTVPLRLN